MSKKSVGDKPETVNAIDYGPDETDTVHSTDVRAVEQEDVAFVEACQKRLANQLRSEQMADSIGDKPACDITYHEWLIGQALLLASMPDVGDVAGCAIALANGIVAKLDAQKKEPESLNADTEAHAMWQIREALRLEPEESAPKSRKGLLGILNCIQDCRGALDVVEKFNASHRAEIEGLRLERDGLQGQVNRLRAQVNRLKEQLHESDRTNTG